MLSLDTCVKMIHNVRQMKGPKNSTEASILWLGGDAIMAETPNTTSWADGLAPREQAFVSAYIGPANFNASEAIRMAGYRAVDPSV